MAACSICGRDMGDVPRAAHTECSSEFHRRCDAGECVYCRGRTLDSTVCGNCDRLDIPEFQGYPPW